MASELRLVIIFVLALFGFGLVCGQQCNCENNGGLLEGYIKSEIKKLLELVKVNMIKDEVEKQLEEKLNKRVKEEVEKELDDVREGNCKSFYSKT